MNQRAKNLTLYAALIVIGVYFLFMFLVKAKGFLVPLAIAALLGMLLVPVCSKLEKWGMARIWSSLFSTVLAFLLGIGLAYLVGIQLYKIRQDWPQLKKTIVKQMEDIEQFADQYTWLDPQNRTDQWLQQIKDIDMVGSDSKFTRDSSSTSNRLMPRKDTSQLGNSPPPPKTNNEPYSEKGNSTTSSINQSSNGGGMGRVLSTAYSVIRGIIAFLGAASLVFIYLFFFLLYRDKWQKSILAFVGSESQQKAKQTINNSSNIAQQYLLGKLITVLFLAITYGVGLTITGIKYAIFVSIIAGTLTLIPYIGNIIGGGLAILAALLTGGGGGQIVGVLITFTLAQMLENNILTPYIIGDKVNLNPLVSIVAVIAGEYIWGVTGMILAMPVVAIFKVLSDQVNVLQPLGYSISNEDTRSIGGKPTKKVKSWFAKIVNRE